jgi:hypothetical protein
VDVREKDDKNIGLIILGLLLGFGALWYLWYIALPLFGVFILVYVGWKIWRASIENKKKVLISIGVVMCVGVFSWCIVLYPWILPIAILGWILIQGIIDDKKEKRRKLEEEERRVAAFECDAIKERGEVENKWHVIASKLSLSYVILDTNIWMSMPKKRVCNPKYGRDLSRWINVIDPRKHTGNNIYYKSNICDRRKIVYELNECSNINEWRSFVNDNPGYALISLLSSAYCIHVEVVVPATQLDELKNLCDRNAPKSPKWRAGRAAIDRISKLQKYNQIRMPNVTAKPQKSAYLDSVLVTFVKEIDKRMDILKPVKIVTFDKDLLIRLRAASSMCEREDVQILDKEDLKNFLA